MANMATDSWRQVKCLERSRCSSSSQEANDDGEERVVGLLLWCHDSQGLSSKDSRSYNVKLMELLFLLSLSGCAQAEAMLVATLEISTCEFQDMS